MKRAIPFILCAALFLALPLTAYAADDEGVMITVVIPQAPPPEPEPAPSLSEITVFPVAVYENSEGGRREIVRVYELWEHESAEQIPRHSFERDGFHFELAEITRQTLPGFSTKAHTETVTVNTQTNDLSTVIQLLSPTLEFATEDGYFGVLTLDISTIRMEQAGTRTTNSTVTTTREFPHLSSPDMALVPRTVTDRSRTYQLTDVQWREQGSANIDYRDVATSFTAVATYSRTASSTVVTGYVTTAEYMGTVSRISTEVTRYTAYFLGVPIVTPVVTVPPADVCESYGIVNVCECEDPAGTDAMPEDAGGTYGVDSEEFSDAGYSPYVPDADGYEPDADADYTEESKATGESGAPERRDTLFIAAIVMLSLAVAALLCFINKTRIAGFLARIKGSKIAAALIVMLVAAQLTAVSAAAAPPPYSFGGGRGAAVHMDETSSMGNARDRPMDASAPASAAYRYGDFLGTLHVARLRRTVRVYAGATNTAMNSGAGHFSFTGLNMGNTGLVGHNRGRNGFFSFVRLLREGDIITLSAGGITRSYAITLQYTVEENDFSPLAAFDDDRLTLVTCVEYRPGLRRVAVAIGIP